MKKIISVFNQKGGVGKTTTVVNLAYALSKLNKRVLVVDLDPQANTSTGFGVDKKDVATIYDMLANGKTSPVKLEDNLDIIPSNQQFSGFEIEAIAIEDREFLLKELLEEFENYDILLLDCPPSLGIISINALVASTEILIPIQCEYYALEGLSELLKTYKRVSGVYNKDLSIIGVIMCMFSMQNDLAIDVLEEVKSHFPEEIFSVMIPRDVKLAEAPSHGVSIFSYDKNCSGAKAYRLLALELISRLDKDEIKENENNLKDSSKTDNYTKTDLNEKKIEHQDKQKTGNTQITVAENETFEASDKLTKEEEQINNLTILEKENDPLPESEKVEKSDDSKNISEKTDSNNQKFKKSEIEEQVEDVEGTQKTITEANQSKLEFKQEDRKTPKNPSVNASEKQYPGNTKGLENSTKNDKKLTHDEVLNTKKTDKFKIENEKMTRKKVSTNIEDDKKADKTALKNVLTDNKNKSKSDRDKKTDENSGYINLDHKKPEKLQQSEKRQKKQQGTDSKKDIFAKGQEDGKNKSDSTDNKGYVNDGYIKEKPQKTDVENQESKDLSNKGLTSENTKEDIMKEIKSNDIKENKQMNVSGAKNESEEREKILNSFKDYSDNLFSNIGNDLKGDYQKIKDKKEKYHEKLENLTDDQLDKLIDYILEQEDEV